MRLNSDMQFKDTVYDVQCSHTDDLFSDKKFQTDKGVNILIQLLIDERGSGIVHRSVVGRYNQRRGINEDAQDSGKRMPSFKHTKGDEANQRFINLDGTDRFGLGSSVGICAENQMCGVLPVPQDYFKQEQSKTVNIFIRK